MVLFTGADLEAVLDKFSEIEVEINFPFPPKSGYPPCVRCSTSLKSFCAVFDLECPKLREWSAREQLLQRRKKKGLKRK
ncbi:MAG: hypothetical protein QXT73_00525 [Candidatus Methanomethylicaceae archaeon]